MTADNLERSSPCNRNGLRALVGGALCLGALGCSTIRGISHATDVHAPLALTPAEASRARSEGTALLAQQPRDVARASKAAGLLEEAARALPDDWEAPVRAAEALAFVAEHAADPKTRAAAAKRGIILARQARELKPEAVTGHYWYALNVGLLADVDRSYGLNAVTEMEPALKRAIEIDERYDQAGPLRVLGLLHLRTPQPPVSIGSNRKALRLLQRAVDLFPDYPENYLYLAEAQHATGKLDEAAASLHTVLNASPQPGREAELAQWQQNARELQKTWRSNP